jgi:transposase
LIIDLENHIRGALRAYGLRVGQVSLAKFEARIRKRADGARRLCLRSDDHHVARGASYVLEGYDRLHKIVLEVVIHDPVLPPFHDRAGRRSYRCAHLQRRSRTRCAFLERVPWVHILAYHPDAINPERRSTSPRTSPRWATSTRATRPAKPPACSCDRGVGGVQGLGMRIAERQSMMRAIVAVARKLAATLDRLWINGSEFQWSAGAKVTEKIRLKSAKA